MEPRPIKKLCHNFFMLPDPSQEHKKSFLWNRSQPPAIGLHWIGLHWTGLHWIGFHWIGPHWAGLHWIGLHWTGPHWIGFHWIGLHWIGLHWIPITFVFAGYLEAPIWAPGLPRTEKWFILNSGLIKNRHLSSLQPHKKVMP